MARVKVEVRRGLLSPARLQSVFCNSGGFYLYLLERKPFGKDCLPIAAKYASADFGVDRETIRAWLDELGGQNLTRFHRRQYDLCVHIEKAGDHTGNEWVPAEPTHLPDAGSTPHLTAGSDAGSNRHLTPSDAGFDPVSDAGQTPHLKGSLTIAPKRLSPENLPQAADPPRAQGARVGGREAEHLARMIAEAEAAGLDGLAESLRRAAGGES